MLSLILWSSITNRLLEEDMRDLDRAITRLENKIKYKNINTPPHMLTDKEIEEKNIMVGEVSPKGSYKVVLQVTVECNESNTESDARKNAFELIDFATQENDDKASISSIQVNSVVDNNPKVNTNG